jgi:hypothetical protein
VRKLIHLPFFPGLSCILHRLWTRGYDVYTPNKIAVAHDYYDKMLPAGQAPLITVSSANVFFPSLG